MRVENGSTIDVGFSQERFRPGTHICLIYREEQERKNVVAQFVGSGILADEMVYYFADTTTSEEVEQWLADMDVDISTAREHQSISVNQALSIYCPGGIFVPEQMYESIK